MQIKVCRCAGLFLKRFPSLFKAPQDVALSWCRCKNCNGKGSWEAGPALEAILNSRLPKCLSHFPITFQLMWWGTALRNFVFCVSSALQCPAKHGIMLCRHFLTLPLCRKWIFNVGPFAPIFSIKQAAGIRTGCSFWCGQATERCWEAAGTVLVLISGGCMREGDREV